MIIKFKHIKDYEGAAIEAGLDDEMNEWEIRKLLWVNVNNASANDTAIEWLRWNTMTEDPILGDFYMHVRCAIHIVNLIVQDRLKEVDQSILKVWDIVRYVKASP